MKKFMILAALLLLPGAWCLLTAASAPTYDKPSGAYPLQAAGNYIWDANYLDSKGTPGAWIPLGKYTATPSGPTGTTTRTPTITMTPTITLTPFTGVAGNVNSFGQMNINPNGTPTYVAADTDFLLGRLINGTETPTPTSTPTGSPWPTATPTFTPTPSNSRNECWGCVNYNCVDKGSTTNLNVIFASATQTYGQNLIINGMVLTNAGATTELVSITSALSPIFGPESLAPNSIAVISHPIPVPTNAGALGVSINTIETPGVYGDIEIQPRP